LSTLGSLKESNENNTHHLGMIFDIDGTLIAIGDWVHLFILRPGAVDFLKWALERGHTLALWTAATSGWADRVATKLSSPSG
jgi:phosphoserine phosphatase